MSQGQVIIDLDSYELTPEERELILHPATAGIILFSRNYHDKKQLAALTHAIRKVRQPIMIAVDQEGGRVQRFKSDFSLLPPLAHFGELYERDPAQAITALRANTKTLIEELYAVGVNLSLIPVIDLNHGVSEIIGNRSFSQDAATVVTLAKEMIDAMHDLGMPATGKHYPGHGAVVADSHLELPVDERPWLNIVAEDLVPFTQLSKDLDAIMPAHIVYSAIDPNPAGFSSYWLKTVLRKQLGFKGVIMSDDLTMAGAAIAGSYAERATQALDAGCDLLPVCNNRQGCVEVLEHLQNYNDSISADRVDHFMRKIRLG